MAEARRGARDELNEVGPHQSPRVRASSEPILATTPAVGALEGEPIDRVQVADLTRADGRRDGIGSLSELLDAIGVVYPEVASPTQVRFRLA